MLRARGRASAASHVTLPQVILDDKDSFEMADGDASGGSS
jgi:hypothetical protein